MPPNGYFYIFVDINVDWLPLVLCNESIWNVRAGLRESFELPEFLLEYKSCWLMFLNPFKAIFLVFFIASNARALF